MLWEAGRLEDDHRLLKEYGLKNQRELWRMETILRKIRREARRLLAARGAGIEGRAERLLGRAKRFLINKAQVTLDDILALSTRDILERRLETLVVRKGMAKTLGQSRQAIVHGHIAVSGNKTTSPSRLIAFSEETDILWYSKPIRYEGAGGELAKEEKPEGKVAEAEKPVEKQAQGA
jgi:small subunit ribosomal protein S4